MKKLVVFLSFIILSCKIYSQVQIYGRYTVDGKVEPSTNIFVTKKITEKIKMTYFGLVEQKWSEALIGIAYSPAKFIELGVGGGLEQNPALYRLTASLWLGKDKVSLLIIGEKGDGKDNYWYKSVAKYEFSDKISAGAMGWRFHGVGPFVDFTIKKLDSKIWINPVFDFEFEQKRIMVGIDIKI